MYRVAQSVDHELRPGGTIKFEGAGFGAETSFFHVKAPPDSGATLHVHPYAETWIVLAGRVRFTVGEAQFEAAAGQIAVAGENTPHAYWNIGSEMLEMICIHPSPRVIQHDLE